MVLFLSLSKGIFNGFMVFGNHRHQVRDGVVGLLQLLDGLAHTGQNFTVLRGKFTTQRGHIGMKGLDSLHLLSTRVLDGQHVLLDLLGEILLDFACAAYFVKQALLDHFLKINDVALQGLDLDLVLCNSGGFGHLEFVFTLPGPLLAFPALFFELVFVLLLELFFPVLCAAGIPLPQAKHEQAQRSC